MRRYFLSHFGDETWGDFFSGHITARNKEYRKYSDERLDEEYFKHKDDLNIFEIQPDVSDIREQLTERNAELDALRKQMEIMRNQMNVLMAGKLIEMDKKKG